MSDKKTFATISETETRLDLDTHHILTDKHTGEKFTPDYASVTYTSGEPGRYFVSLQSPVPDDLSTYYSITDDMPDDLHPLVKELIDLHKRNMRIA